ncbi:MAG: carboxypeptidase regulatory-like domain-containing protein, partial [Acidobacteria bacterium]|nr:carboxypeptidase regulatory-like domain-containing protein [Acidobacteriota bacterium]
ISKVQYAVTVTGTAVAMRLSFDAVVAAPGTLGQLSLPGALVEAVEDTGPVPISLQQGDGGTGPTLQFPKAGTYHVAVRFLLTERQIDGARRVDLPFLPAATGRLVLERAFPGARVLLGGPDVPDEALLTSRPVTGGSRLHLTVTVPGRVPEAQPQPVLEVESVDVATPLRESLVMRTVHRLVISRAPLAEIRLAVPRGARLLASAGPGDVAGTLETPGGGDAPGVLTFRPVKEITGETFVTALLSIPLGAAEARIAPVLVHGASTSRRWLLLAPSAARETEVPPQDGWVRTDVSDLPPLARPFAVNATRAYRALSASPATARDLVVAFPRRVLEPNAETLVTDAVLETVLGEAGTRTDRQTLTVETRRPLLRLPLAADQEILSVRVDGQPARPQTDGTFLVLTLPQATGGVHNVSVETRTKAVQPVVKGPLTVTHPGLALASPRLAWTVILPSGNRYRVTSASGVRKVSVALDDVPIEERLAPTKQAWARSTPSAAPPPTFGSSVLRTVALDASGQALPGVSVTIKPRNGGPARTGVTDASGVAMFPGLDPGAYDVSHNLSGFQSVSRVARVSSGPSTEVVSNLPLSTVVEGITVTGEAPVVDVTKTNTSMNFTADMIHKTPGSKIGTHGATRSENSFLVDGLNTREAGTRSLDVQIEGRGKRVLLMSPMAAPGPLSVTFDVKKG